jgi:hypothetical protein
MTDLPTDPIGAAWLAQAYAVKPLARFPVVSQIGRRRATLIKDGFRVETYAEHTRPMEYPAAHLQFYLRHEVVQMEFLARCSNAQGQSSSRLG